MKRGTLRGLAAPGLYERFGRDAQTLVQPADHGQCQGALARQDLMDAVAAAYVGDEIVRTKPPVLHMVLDGFDRVRQIERVVLRLPSFDQRNQHVEAVALWRAPLGSH